MVDHDCCSVVDRNLSSFHVLLLVVLLFFFSSDLIR
ncbi:unnamed protein product [Spirodela intermedia]|uniref:Uncharacterized protein n=1 Tax=Spirodela intermedia TaxID=51605 RepID=A0A7I8IS71_SPIIN|nr:unnamed protein product [Spirodela intermedia]CAA6660605.1 unnamed protein product [Spirodela intermedia]